MGWGGFTRCTMTRHPSCLPRRMDIRLEEWNVVSDKYVLTSGGQRIPFDCIASNVNDKVMQMIAQNAVNCGDSERTWKTAVEYSRTFVNAPTTWDSARFVFAILFANWPLNLRKMAFFNRNMTGVISTVSSEAQLFNEAYYLANLGRKRQ